MDTSKKAKEKYSKLVDELTPKSKVLKDVFRSFVSGGLICVFGQFLKEFFLNGGFEKEEAALLVNMVFIGIAALLTGLGLYSKLGKFCGGGTIVPITGFANSMVSSSIEAKAEGWILGIGAAMFSIAGPVIVYGITSSMVVGLIYYFVK